MSVTGNHNFECQPGMGSFQIRINTAAEIFNSFIMIRWQFVAKNRRTLNSLFRLLVISLLTHFLVHCPYGKIIGWRVQCHIKWNSKDIPQSTNRAETSNRSDCQYGHPGWIQCYVLGNQYPISCPGVYAAQTEHVGVQPGHDVVAQPMLIRIQRIFEGSLKVVEQKLST